MTLTKAKVVDSISNHLHVSKNRSSEIVDSLLEIMKRELESGDDILISGFGKFCVKDRSTRKWRNPATDESTLLGARRIVTFRCSSVMRNKLNEKK
jgi:integration host factor subunit alpha